MKRNTTLAILALGVALALVGCSADSPTAPKPSPTPATVTMTLTASVSEAAVEDTVLITAYVTAGGKAVADNTSVFFSAPPPAYFILNGLQQNDVTITTSNGNAVAHLRSMIAGIAQVTARVGSVSKTVSVKFAAATDPRNLQIYSIQPTRGKPEGGDTVTIYGYGFLAMATTGGKHYPQVKFVIAGDELDAQVLLVNSTGTQIQVSSPLPDQTIAKTQEQVADVKVIGVFNDPTEGVKEVTATLASSFTYDKYNPDPQVFSLTPNYSAPSGGGDVAVLGANFKKPLRVWVGSQEAYVTIEATDAVFSEFKFKVPTYPHTLTEPLAVDFKVVSAADTADEKTVTLTGGFHYVLTTGGPVIYHALPNRGRAAGGESVKLYGYNFGSSPSVEFQIGAPVNNTLPVQVLAVDREGAFETISIVTPQASPNPVLQDAIVLIRVTVGEESDELANGFVYLGDVGKPQLFYVQPNHGSMDGNEEVTIFGRYLVKPVRVHFEGVAEARVTKVADDGLSVTVLTPPVPYADVSQSVAVKVTTQADTGREQSETLAAAFMYDASGGGGSPTPELFGLSPNNGPLEGGTRVTIIGKGFQYPVQVLFSGSPFGEKQAQVVSTNADQIVCISPSITSSGPSTPTTAQVSVVNLKTGKKSAASLTFRYGESLYISSIVPNRGSMEGDTVVTIFGQGFVAPVVVTLGSVQAQVLSVSGTEIVIKTPPVASDRRSCSEQSAEVKVTNVGSNLSTTFSSFIYYAMQPLLSAATLDGNNSNIVPEYNVTPPLNCSIAWSSHTVHLHGAGFEKRDNTIQSAMVVQIEGLGTVEIPTTFVSENEVTFTLPDLTGIPLDSVTCMVAGVCGQQYVDTPLNITIKNIVNGCSDTLPTALFIRPCDTSCRPTLTSLVLTATSPQTRGVPFLVGLNPTPNPLTSSVQVRLISSGFTVTPQVVTLAAYQVGVQYFSVTATTLVPGSVTGSLFAQAGEGVCAVSSGTPVTIVLNPPAATLSSVNPNNGPTSGSTNVTINGTNLTGATSVTFGGVAATNVVVATGGNQVTCTTPAAAGGAGGPVNVEVVTSAGPTTLANGFTYNPSLTITRTGTTLGTVTTTVGTPTPINCGATCTAFFTYSATTGITLTSTTAPTSWGAAGSPCAACAAGTTCTTAPLAANATCAVTYP